MLPFANDQIDAGQLSAGLEFLPCRAVWLESTAHEGSAIQRASFVTCESAARHDVVEPSSTIVLVRHERAEARKRT